MLPVLPGGGLFAATHLGFTFQTFDLFPTTVGFKIFFKKSSGRWLVRATTYQEEGEERGKRCSGTRRGLWQKSKSCWMFR
jgi:hypothetical protein